jgi:hypothetical protein
MITSSDVQVLQGLTKKTPVLIRLGQGTPATQAEREATALLHSGWFALELPDAAFDTDIERVESTPFEEALAWRKRLPAGDGEYAQASRGVDKDQKPFMRLIADSETAYVDPSIYNVVLKQVTAPEFRVFPGEKLPVAILSAGKVVGVVAQVALVK